MPRPRAARARVGVDISEEMLARARRLYDGVEFALGDAEELAFEDDAFDAAVAAFLLHHVPSPERVVARARARRAARRRRAVGRGGAGAADRPAHRRDRGGRRRAARPAGRSARRGSGSRATRSCAACSKARDSSTSGVDTVAFVEPMRDTDELWEGVLGGSVNTRATVLAQPPDVQQRIRDELDRLVEPHRREDGIDVPVSVRIASAARTT